jgi:hypothetical protein
MAVPHYAYLALKILGPKGVITVQGSFKVSNTCDKEFNRMAQTFGMTTEYARLKGETDHNVLPDVGRSLPNQVMRVNLTNVLDERLRIGEIGRQMNSKVKSVKQGVYRK